MPKKGNKRVALVNAGSYEVQGFKVSSMIIGYTKCGTPIVVEADAVGSITCCLGEGLGTHRLIIAKSEDGSPITMDLDWEEGKGLIMPTVRQIKAELQRLGLKK